MGLRPTNSDENHAVGHALGLRRLSGRPDGLSITYGGFSTVCGSSKARFSEREQDGVDAGRRTGVLPHAACLNGKTKWNLAKASAHRLKPVLPTLGRRRGGRGAPS